MGLLDNLAGGLQNILSNQGGQNNLLESIGSMITNQETGGLPGLIQSFKDKGLGDIVSSWISTGKNLPISADQIRSVLDPSQLQTMADKLGISTKDVSQHLSEYLPKVIDKLTPDGSVPGSNDLISQGLNLMKGKIFGN